MEINTTVALFAAIGTQIITALGLFWAVTNSFNNRINEVENKLSREINEMKVEINEVKVEQAKQGGEIHRLADKIHFLYNLLPMPKLAIQTPQDN
jgi:hypothetical protein